jgi:diguanylate cyclase (GGDEF)-like protein
MASAQTVQAVQALDIYAFSLAILVIVGFRTLRNPNAKTIQARLFAVLVLLTALTIIADGITIYFDGAPGVAMRGTLIAAATLGYTLQSAISYVWLCYVYAVIFSINKVSTKRAIAFAIPGIICALAGIASPLTGWLFTYDSSNVYHRGALFAIAPIMSYSYFFWGYIRIIIDRRRLDKRYLYALLSYMIPPTICGLIQMCLYGVSLFWPSMAISLLIIYLAIQNELLLLDYSTGINNRLSLDRLLRRKIANARDGISFAVLLVDLDGLTSINDRYGHSEGDSAIRTMAHLLDENFRHDGFVARFGGDEFAVIVNLRDSRSLDAIKVRVQTAIDEWNAASGKKWRLSASMACAPYIPSDHLSADNFLLQVDKMLTLDKIFRK